MPTLKLRNSGKDPLVQLSVNKKYVLSFVYSHSYFMI